MENKICLVTGANAGIGLETARGLAQEGATVVMVCRNRERGEKAQSDIQESTGNQDVHLYIADLAAQKQIRDLASRFLSEYDRLDVLINNAGVFLPDLQLTEEDYEATFAINHLAYFLLTHLLLDTIKSTPGARIVNVSSNAHQSARINFDALEKVSSYNGFVAYGQSKLANVLFTYELARRLEGTGITCNALHPGVVATNIANQGLSFFTVFFRLFSPFFKSPESGAATSLYLASSPDVAGTTGKYFADKSEKKSSPRSHDESTAKRLWDLSCTLTGIPQ